MEMDPDLVRPSRMNLAQNQGPSACLLDHFELCVSGPTTIEDRHFLTMHRVAADRCDYVTD